MAHPTEETVPGLQVPALNRSRAIAAGQTPRRGTGEAVWQNRKAVWTKRVQLRLLRHTSRTWQLQEIEMLSRAADAEIARLTRRTLVSVTI